MSLLTINGIFPCSGREGQLWPFVSGPFAPEVGILVHSELDKNLEDLANPISLKIEGEFYYGLKKEKSVNTQSF